LEGRGRETTGGRRGETWVGELELRIGRVEVKVKVKVKGRE
jgi:hypothetical protein